ncbi:GIY-YIG nuclease family protein [Pseudarthrobacter sp. B4EP4b]|uniref:GIY-YIG nuclease family protein n=1 Tax=Pseudarthrobacter sp. B4EP4b TaxID=2590664 RepID=UPI0011514185|nr:GIY-YIG nuclease family protein [Pseudarthrobacter sp. B4EP4b]
MFGTVIWDVYGRDEAKDLRDAIEDLASATDSLGWSSSGVYAFYDPDPQRQQSPSSHALRYLGLATDLSSRFAQHNGIVDVKPGSSKFSNIEAWFDKHPLLGYSAFVQSPLHQANIARLKKEIGSTVVDWSIDFDHDIEARRSIAMLEGQLIETAVLDRGLLPPWNKIGGSMDGKSRALDGSGSALIGLMEGVYDNLFVARRSIREISNDPTIYFDESDTLHAARMQALVSAGTAGASNSEIISQLSELAAPGHVWSHLIDSARVAWIRDGGYLNSTTRVVHKS